MKLLPRKPETTEPSHIAALSRNGRVVLGATTILSHTCRLAAAPRTPATVAPPYRYCAGGSSITCLGRRVELLGPRALLIMLREAVRLLLMSLYAQDHGILFAEGWQHMVLSKQAWANIPL